MDRQCRRDKNGSKQSGGTPSCYVKGASSQKAYVYSGMFAALKSIQQLENVAIRTRYVQFDQTIQEVWL